ncbi:MAG: hypothetical protein ABI844_07200 [Saprospiraceae bacterium]
MEIDGGGRDLGRDIPIHGYGIVDKNYTMENAKPKQISEINTFDPKEIIYTIGILNDLIDLSKKFIADYLKLKMWLRLKEIPLEARKGFFYLRIGKEFKKLDNDIENIYKSKALKAANILLLGYSILKVSQEIYNNRKLLMAGQFEPVVEIMLYNSLGNIVSSIMGLLGLISNLNPIFKAIITSFSIGFSIGEQINNQLGLSDKIADKLYYLLNEGHLFETECRVYFIEDKKIERLNYSGVTGYPIQ